MNEKAQELNLSDSTFNNPSGLDIDDEGNISTSFDIASLYSYCLENNLFKAIVSTKNYSINNVSWRNKNYFIDINIVLAEKLAIHIKPKELW